MQFSDRVLMELWNILGGEEVRPKNFTMNNARKFFYDACEKYPEAEKCVLKVVPRGNGYEVTQVMLDKEDEMIKTGQDFCVGRKIFAEQIDKSVWNFLNGKEWRIMEG